MKGGGFPFVTEKIDWVCELYSCGKNGWKGRRQERLANALVKKTFAFHYKVEYGEKKSYRESDASEVEDKENIYRRKKKSEDVK